MLQNHIQPDTGQSINLSDYFPVVKKDLSLGNETFAVPFGFDTLALYYNPELLQKAGVSVPTNWTEFKAAAKKLTIRCPLQ